MVSRRRRLIAEWLEPRTLLTADFGFVNTISSSYFENASAIALDSAGNVYLTGQSELADFDPGPGVFIPPSVGAWGAFVAKYSPGGELLWAKQVGGSDWSRGNDLTIDPIGNVWVAGIYAGTADFDMGDGVANQTAVGSEGHFLLKLSSDGVFQWVGTIEGSVSESISGIASDSSGNLIAVGSFAGMTDFDLGPGTFELSSVANTHDSFVMKLDQGGNLLWAKSWGGDVTNGPGDGATDVAVDPAGNAFVTGFFSDTTDLDPGPGVQLFTTNGGSLDYDNYISKFDPAGNLVWVRVRGGSAIDGTNVVIALGSDGGIYTSGRFESTYDFDPGPGTAYLTDLGNHDIFVAKLDAAGNYLWAVQMGGSSDLPETSEGIFVDGTDVYATGHFAGSGDFDPGNGVFTLGPAGGTHDAFIVRLDGAGNFVWAQQVGGSDFDIGQGIAVNSATKEVYVLGTFEETVDFDPGPGTENRTSAGSYDVFLLNLTQDQAPDTNSPPSATADAYDVTEDSPLVIALPGLLANDFDPDAEDTKRVVAVNGNSPIVGSQLTLPSGAFVRVQEDGGLRYDPNGRFESLGAGQTATDSFAYTMADGDGAISSAIVTMTIHGANDAPLIPVHPVLSLVAEGGLFSRGGLFWDIDAGDSATATVDYADGSGPQPLALAPNKHFQLSHTYADDGNHPITVVVRDAGNLTGSATFHVQVTNVAPHELTFRGPPLASRGQSLAFVGSFTDPGIFDTHVATIDWGDGTTSAGTITKSGDSWRVDAAHAYAAGGIYQAVLKVSDDDGGIATQTTTVFVVGASLDRGALEIVGTSQRDSISLSLWKYGLRLSGTLGSNPISATFNLSAVQQIVAKLGGGSDSLIVDGRIRARLVVDAGAGYDSVTAGGGAAILIGGTGNDTLTGGSGRDLLIGGAGQDRLSGRSANDLLIAGTTAYDQNTAALLAILAEWTSTRSLSARGKNIRAGTGPLLQNTGIKLKPDTTVFADTSIDTLFGGGDLDWFFYERLRDRISDKALGELVN